MPALRALLATALAVLVLASGCRSADSSTDSSTARPSVGAGYVSAPTDPESGLRWIEESDLPAEARDTLRLIDEGGPFPYDEDGSRFGNYEAILPAHPLGYYEEYTVGTPGRSDRGARRLVVGEEGETYWTRDHYDSFDRVRR